LENIWRAYLNRCGSAKVESDKREGSKRKNLEILKEFAFGRAFKRLETAVADCISSKY